MSVKVQPGGMFNSYKVKYSPETHQLLKVLMDEVKLTTAQRQEMRESLKKGEPLPVVPRRRAKPSFVDENLFDLKRNFYFMRRTKDQIIHSGAYEREKYRFLERTVDLEKEKERLRNILVYGKNKKNVPSEKGKKEKEKKNAMVTPEERLEELVVEIEERIEFLKEMESLGEAKQYEATIKQEIAAKLREMKKLDKNSTKKYLDILQAPKKPKTKIEEAILWNN